eukprot:jgi/Chrzof1/10257/Cz04g34150.t1
MQHTADQLETVKQQLQKLSQECQQAKKELKVTTNELASAEASLQASQELLSSMKQQLQEATSVQRTAEMQASSLRHQLDEVKGEHRSTSSELHALRDVLSRYEVMHAEAKHGLQDSQVKQQDLEGMLAAERSRHKCLQQELSSSKTVQANSSLKLMEVQGSLQLLEEKLRSSQAALGVERATLEAQEQELADLRFELSMTKTRAEQAEGQQRQAAGRLMMCQEACEAEAVARKAADDQVGLLKAEAKVAQDKFMELQRESLEASALGSQQQKEMSERLTASNAALARLKQSMETRRFSQMEGLTRAAARVEELSNRVVKVESLATAMCSLDAKTQEERLALMEEMETKLTEWEGWGLFMGHIATRMNSSLNGLRLQSNTAQMHMKSSMQGSEILQGQLVDMQDELAAAGDVERRLRAQISVLETARLDDAEKARSNLAEADAKTAAAEAASHQLQEKVHELQQCIQCLELGLMQGAGANGDAVQLRALIGAKQVELAVITSAVKASMARVERGASDLKGMLSVLGNMGVEDDEMSESTLADSSQTNAADLADDHQVPAQAAAAASTAHVASTSMAMASAGHQPEVEQSGVQQQQQQQQQQALPSQPDTQLQPQAVPDSAQLSHSEAGLQFVVLSTPGTDGTPSVDEADDGQMLSASVGNLLQKVHSVKQAFQVVAQEYPHLQRDWREQEREIASTLAKLLHAEESLASNYTCLACLSIFKDPVTCIPCGHNYCRSCLIAAGGKCQECGQGSSSSDGAVDTTAYSRSISSSSGSSQAVVRYVPAHDLDRLCSKFEYKLSALQSMHRVFQRRSLSRVTSRVGSSMASRVASRLPSRVGSSYGHKQAYESKMAVSFHLPSLQAGEDMDD